MQKEPKVEYPYARLPTKTWTILFLDGAENIARLKDAGKDAGHAVIGARTIEEAWAFLDGKDHVDAIVCAAHLEEGSMFDFLQSVRDSEVHRNTKFLILALAPSAMGARLHGSTASAGAALGADSYAIMPVFDPLKLLTLIRNLQLPVPVRQQSAAGDGERRVD